jgi:hypothetical protein
LHKQRGSGTRKVAGLPGQPGARCNLTAKPRSLLCDGYIGRCDRAVIIADLDMPVQIMFPHAVPPALGFRRGRRERAGACCPRGPLSARAGDGRGMVRSWREPGRRAA